MISNLFFRNKQMNLSRMFIYLLHSLKIEIVKRESYTSVDKNSVKFIRSYNKVPMLISVGDITMNVQSVSSRSRQRDNETVYWHMVITLFALKIYFVYLWLCAQFTSITRGKWDWIFMIQLEIDRRYEINWY